MVFRLILVALIAQIALLAPGCAGYLGRIQPPGDSGGTTPSDAPQRRLDPQVMTRFLGAQVALARPAPSDGPDTRSSDAVSLLQEALALAPEESALWGALASARGRGGDYTAAAAAARQAVVLDPANARARYQLGELLHRLGELGEAEEHLRLAASAGIGGDDPHLPHYYLYFVLKEQGRVDEALGALAAWIAALPEDPYPPVLRAQLLREYGRVEEAREAALAALRQNPGSEDALAVYLDTFRIDHGTESRWTDQDARSLPEAVRGIEEVLAADWSRPRLHRVVLSLYERMGRYDRAAEHLRFVRILGRQRRNWLEEKEVDLLVRQHRHREAQERIATILERPGLDSEDRSRLLLFKVTSQERSGDVDGALKTLNGIDPTSPHYGLAAARRVRLLLDDGELAGAATAAISARGHVPPRESTRHAMLLDLAARARLGLGDLDGARDLIEELEQLDPRGALDRRVELDAAGGDLARAVARIKDRLAREPGDAGLAVLLADTLVLTGDPEAARAAFGDAEAEVARWEAARLGGASPGGLVEVAAQAERQRAFLWVAQAQTLMRIGDFEGAARALKRVLVLRPDDADVLNFLGYVYATADTHLAEAEELVSAALAQRAYSAAVVDSMGWVRFRQGRLAEAEELLQQAARWQPNDPEILDHLAHVQAGLGHPAEARRLWRTALRRIAPHEERTRGLREGINASLRALKEAKAKRSYFEHAGALMTADGTDDDLIKLEGVPQGEKFSF